MANDCAASLFVCMMRVARLLTDGTPDQGADNLYVSDALIKLAWEPDVEEGNELTQKNGCGDIAASHKHDDQVKAYNMTLDLVSPDPELHELLIGGTVLDNGNGYQAPALGRSSAASVSIEAWSKAIIGGDVADNLPWFRWVFPRSRWRPGGKNLEEAFMGVPFVGRATENDNWGNGPANDWDADSTKAFQWLRVPDDDLPDSVCGYQALPAS